MLFAKCLDASKLTSNPTNEKKKTNQHNTKKNKRIRWQSSTHNRSFGLPFSVCVCVCVWVCVLCVSIIKPKSAGLCFFYDPPTVPIVEVCLELADFPCSNLCYFIIFLSARLLWHPKDYQDYLDWHTKIQSWLWACCFCCCQHRTLF